MPRWEPNTPDRLAAAAIALFTERGYEATRVDDIAAAAGITRSTFFRNVRDKQEVLFAGQAAMADDLAAAVAGAPAGAGPMDAVAAGLAALADGWFVPERRADSRRRGALVAATPELREREAVKHAALVAALARGLRDRGTPETDAAVAAHLGGVALSLAAGRWSAGEDAFEQVARDAVAEVCAAARTLAG